MISPIFSLGNNQQTGTHSSNRRSWSHGIVCCTDVMHGEQMNHHITRTRNNLSMGFKGKNEYESGWDYGLQ
jgi:hypothetical protein